MRRSPYKQLAHAIRGGMIALLLAAGLALAGEARAQPAPGGEPAENQAKTPDSEEEDLPNKASELPEFAGDVEVFDRMPQQAERSRSTTTLTPKAMDGQHAGNMNDYLFAGIPGVATSRRSNVGFSGPNAGFLVRGLTGPRVAVFVDGIPVQVNNHFHPRSDQFSPDLIQRMEVTRGPSPVLHGPSAVGGVVEIFTRRPPVGASGYAQILVGELATQETQGDFGYGWESGSALVSFMDRETDAQVLGEAFDLTNINFKLSQDFGRGWRLGLRASNTDEPASPRFGNDPNEVFFRFTQDMTTYVASLDRTTESTRNLVAVHWNELDTGSFRETQAGGPFFQNERIESEVGVVARHTRVWSPGRSLTVGIDAVEFSDENPRGTPEHSESFVAGYGHTSWALGDASQIEGGLRVTQSGQFGTDVSPELGYIRSLQPDLALRLRGGKAFRVPRVSEIHGAVVNEDLEPEDFYFAEIGLNKLFERRAELDAAVWWMEGDNLIQRVGAGAAQVNLNTGSFSHYGLESSVNFRATDHLSLLGAVAVLSVDADTSFVPQQTVDFGVDYTRGPFRAGGLLRWAGDNSTAALDDYLVGNLRFGYEVWGGLTALVDVLNFTDETYATITGFGGGIEQVPRTVLAGVRYRFRPGS